ncbi:unnamed protein product [Chilo suppressalis]|uniref:FHA domain-containing protein n=1 Tax=Chilo suppressalis TaxID=168631 RepID=A0ABN8L6I8_CHISP|nr:unnamed protein product [Chilo suppressalis]
MKSKKRHQTSSEESEQSDDSAKSSSSSDSETEESSASEHRYKKKRKRAGSSDSESDSEDHKRSKKRKHKKKKKKHEKKKRRANSEEVSASAEEVSSVSEGEISPKKKRKHKHKHSKRAHNSSESEIEEVHVERRLHSVVKERRAASEDSQPSRTYYQKEYRHSASDEEYEREREVQRFYRGSSKERKHQYQEQYYDRDRNNRFGSYHPDKNKDKYGNFSHYNDTNQDFSRRQQEMDEYKRQHRYEEHRPQGEYRKKPKEDAYHPQRDDTRGYQRYNQYEDRGPKRRDYDDGRDYRERRPEGEQYRERDYPDKRDKYREEAYAADRQREAARRERPGRSDKPSSTHDRVASRSRSPDGRYRDRPPARVDRGNDRSGVEKNAARGMNRGGDRGPDRGDRGPDRGDRGPDRGGDRPRPSARSNDKPRERKTRFGEADDKEYTWGKTEVKKEGDKNPGDKEKPNFGLSGKLTADQNTVNGVVIKYTEPDDAKQPKRRWRFYPFKGDKALPILYIHRQSAFLIGRDKKVVDIALEHPSISKQHAALQFRATPFTRPDGSQGRRVRPYVIDLDSANGTFVNNKKIDGRRYVELLERDVVKFGFSQREYVLLHENSKDDAQDDDNDAPPVTTTDQIKQEKRVKQELVEDGD